MARYLNNDLLLDKTTSQSGLYAPPSRANNPCTNVQRKNRDSRAEKHIFTERDEEFSAPIRYLFVRRPINIDCARREIKVNESRIFMYFYALYAHDETAARTSLDNINREATIGKSPARNYRARERLPQSINLRTRFLPLATLSPVL